MKTKLVAKAGGLACVFATTAMPIHAEELYTAVSGSTASLGVDANGDSLGTLGQTVSIPLKKNGKKYNKEGATIVTKSKTLPTGLFCYSGELGAWGALLEYEYADSVSTQANGDLVFASLDPNNSNDPAKVSNVCVFGPTHFEVTIYSVIKDGTGEYAGACGWQKTTRPESGFSNFFIYRRDSSGRAISQLPLITPTVVRRTKENT